MTLELVDIDEFVEPERVDYRCYGATAELFELVLNPSRPYYEILIEGPANTGKTRGLCELTHHLCTQFPGTRWLWARHTLVSLRQSVLPTFEDHVLGGSTAMFKGNASRETRSSYVYLPIDGQESEIVLAGLRPSEIEKTFSTEFDGVFFFESIEVGFKEAQKLKRALRWRRYRPDSLGGEAFHFWLHDTNPGSEYAWQNQYFPRPVFRGIDPLTNYQVDKEKVAHRLLSKHADNPAITAAELATLDTLRGADRKRLRDGEWVGESGQVLPDFDPKIHVVKFRVEPLEPPELCPDCGWVFVDDGESLMLLCENTDCDYEWDGRVDDHPRRRDGVLDLRQFYAAQDWGFTNPGSLQVWGVNADNEAYLVLEHYYTRKETEWWAERLAEACDRFPLVSGWADTNDPEAVIKYNRLLRNKGVKARFRPATKARKTGIAVLRDAFRPFEIIRGEDGERMIVDKRPRMYLCEGALDEADPSLVENMKPTCFQEEIPGWVFPAEDEISTTTSDEKLDDPIKKNDHGCFPAGTPVLMADGSWRPIVAVEAGEFVATPNGPERVVDSVLTGIDAPLVEIEHERGRLRCTPDHPVWVEGRGMIRADGLRYGMVLACATNASADSGQHGIATQVATTAAATTPAGMKGAGGACTASSGSATAERSRPASTSTTGTATEPTTGSPTSNSSRRPSMAPCTASTPTGVSKPASDDGASAGLGASVDAERRSTTRPSSAPSSARTPARALHGSPVGSTTNAASAPSARPFSRSTATLPRGLARARVLAVRPAGRSDVFNLTVEPSHVFFAGGALVSNCDAARYLAMGLFGKEFVEVAEPERFEPGTLGELAGHNEEWSPESEMRKPSRWEPWEG